MFVLVKFGQLYIDFMTLFSYLLSLFDNLISNLFRYQLTYLVSNENWVIKQEGENIVEHLNDTRLLKSRTSLTPYFLAPQIIHFGSENIYFSKIGSGFPYAAQKLILTWFHVLPDKKRLELIKKIQGNFKFIHTASFFTKNQLVQAGVDAKKIVVIPLGVDLDLFKHLNNNDKVNLRQELGLPKDRIIIGSFQKDGVGWNEGEEPKLIKGPDIFVNAVEKLKKYNPFVLLTGPARGYVKKKLAEKNIEFKHFYPKSHSQMCKLYQALDLYIVSSRIEGGPKAIVEAMACGIPIVSTKVGMAEDVIRDNENGMLSEIEDVDALASNAERIILNDSFRKFLIKNGLETIKKYDYSVITKEYYQKMYKKLL